MLHKPNRFEKARKSITHSLLSAKLLVAVALVAALFALTSGAYADAIGFTGGNGSSGTGSAVFNTASGSFSIADAEIDQVSIDGISYGVTGGTLSLSTGSCALCSGTIGIFGSGGSLDITGGVTTGLGTAALGSLLLGGNYLSGAMLSINSGLGTFQAYLDPATLSVNSAILPSGQTVTAGSNQEMEIDLTLSGLDWSGGVSTSSISLTTSPIATPEPATILLSAVGLAGLLLLRRRPVWA